MEANQKVVKEPTGHVPPHHRCTVKVPPRNRQERIRGVPRAAQLLFAGQVEDARRSRVRVSTENIVGIIIAVSLIGYLVLAYLFPERF